MGEQVILVCDVCGRPATQTATIRVGKRNFVKDFCSTHLSELTAGARAPRRGRRPGGGGEDRGEAGTTPEVGRRSEASGTPAEVFSGPQASRATAEERRIIELVESPSQRLHELAA